MSLNQTEALRIFNERCRSPTLKVLAVGDTDVKGPERDPIFGFVSNAWYIRFYLEDRPTMRTHEHIFRNLRLLNGLKPCGTSFCPLSLEVPNRRFEFRNSRRLSSTRTTKRLVVS